MTGTKRKKPSDGEPTSSHPADGSRHGAMTYGTRLLRGRPAPGVDADTYFRDLYLSELDFRQLGREDPEFGLLLRSGNLNFNNPAAVMQLTKTLLKIDYGLKIELPHDRLCPPVPVRHNYILWLKELIDGSSYAERGRKVTGLDIGTGASCIYPLLACQQRNWSFIATDVDPKSLSFAKKNIELNHVQHRIQVISRQSSDPLIPAHPATVDFTMTNPPFYESDADLLASAKQKSRPPLSACTGAAVEMVTPGGEVAFVTRILEESLTLRDAIQWYTSMLGKQTSLETIVEKLREYGINNYAVTEFVQGNKTRRWAVAWSFAPMRPSAHASRGMKADKWKRYFPPSNEVEILTIPLDVGVGAVAERVDSLMTSLELVCWAWDKHKLRGTGRARENVWSRAWRRKKAREQEGGKNKAPDGDHDSSFCALGFEIDIDIRRAGMVVSCRWREGLELSVFESFCGFLKTQLTHLN
ncbi:DUF890 domain-containing protein [Verticillium dahliae]|nr:DUF890 domain-containing protein [Verticillium dahliae]